MQATKSLQDGIIGCVSELPNEFTESRQRFLGYLNKENIELPHFNQTSLATLFYETKRSKLLSSEYITSQPLPLQQRFMAILDSVKQRWASSYLYAIPNQGLKQVMSPQEFRAHLALRLMFPS